MPSTNTVELPPVWVDDSDPEPEEFRGVALDGPVCGTTLAQAHVLVVYTHELGGMFLREDDFCCHRHVPDKTELVPGDSDILIMHIADGVNKTCVTYLDGRAYVVPVPEELIEKLLAA